MAAACHTPGQRLHSAGAACASQRRAAVTPITAAVPFQHQLIGSRNNNNLARTLVGIKNSSRDVQRQGVCHATDFHQSLLTATERDHALQPLDSVAVREAGNDDELQAASWLRALSFYRYPEERKFAAQVHRLMVAEEEFKALKAAALDRKLGTDTGNERSTCLVALCPAAELTGGSDGSDEDEHFKKLVVAGGSGEDVAVVGTLDLYAVRALQGEVLIGDSRNAAYLANVCTAAAARRRGVGQALLATARQLAVSWGVDALYVHTMAVNEIAVRFYERNGFVVEKEESSNQAHYRGRCLDGIEGRGRTLLLRDTRLRQ